MDGWLVGRKRRRTSVVFLKLLLVLYNNCKGKDVQLETKDLIIEAI